MDRILYLVTGPNSMLNSQIKESIDYIGKECDLDVQFLAHRTQKDTTFDSKYSLSFIDGKFMLKLLLQINPLNNLLDLNIYRTLYCRGTLAGWVGIIVKKYYPNIKLITDFRGLVSDELNYNSNIFKSIKSILYRVLERKIYLLSDLLFVVSSNFKNHILSIEKSINSNKIVPIRPFVNHNKFKYNKLERIHIRKELGLKDQDISLIYVGGVSSWQMVPDMFYLYHELKKLNSNFRFILITHNVKSLEKVLSKNNIDLGDVIVKSVSNEEVSKYLNAADFGLLLRDSNLTNHVAYPTKFSEYLLSGLPVIMTRNIGCISDTSPDNSIILEGLEKIDYFSINYLIQNRDFNRFKISKDYLKLLSNKEIYEKIKSIEK